MRMASHFKQQQIRSKKQRTLETEHTQAVSISKSLLRDSEQSKRNQMPATFATATTDFRISTNVTVNGKHNKTSSLFAQTTTPSRLAKKPMTSRYARIRPESINRYTPNQADSAIVKSLKEPFSREPSVMVSKMDNKVKADKVLIEVNKYVHPVQVIPHQIKPETLTAWQEQRESNAFSRIKSDIQDIDDLIVNLFVG